MIQDIIRECLTHDTQTFDLGDSCPLGCQSFTYVLKDVLTNDSSSTSTPYQTTTTQPITTNKTITTQPITTNKITTTPSLLNCYTKNDFDCSGNDMPSPLDSDRTLTFYNTNPINCANQCRNYIGCTGFSFRPPSNDRNGMCVLKNDINIDSCNRQESTDFKYYSDNGTCLSLTSSTTSNKITTEQPTTTNKITTTSSILNCYKT